MAGLEDLTVPELLNEAKRLQQQSALFNTLVTDPTTREDALRLVKKVDPKRSIPEIDARDAMQGQIDAEKLERVKLEARIRDSEIRERLDRERARVMKQHDLSEQEMLEVEKIMTREDAPIPHFDAAAKVFKAERQLAIPTTSAIADFRFQMPTDERWKSGIGNNAKLNRVAMDIAAETLNELRGARKPA